MEILTHCTLYKLTPLEPIFSGHWEEGNIAYYGLILQSKFDQNIRDYLLQNSREGLWEYQHGYGVTSADSAFVIEGLLESGVDPNLLKPAVQKLVEQFYSQEDGAFKTVLKGRAAYWRGVSVETTAHVAYLIHRIAPELYAKEVQRCAEYITHAQNEHGFWTGKWFPSVLIPTYYSIRLLHQMDGVYTKNLDRAKEWVMAQQQPDGSWARSVIDSAAAVLALATISGCADVVEKGQQWLLSKKQRHGWPGEAVLYYWFEEGDEKLFFCCHDKGRITSAWAQLALSAGQK